MENTNDMPSASIPEDTSTESGGAGCLEEEARKRKERLKALRAKIHGDIEEPLQQNEGEGTSILPTPTFRSYKPEHEELRAGARPQITPVDVEAEISDSIEQGHVNTLLEDVEFTNLAPRKPDWDLKRDVAGKLQKLERRTQKAISELILTRLKEEGPQLISQVNIEKDT